MKQFVLNNPRLSSALLKSPLNISRIRTFSSTTHCQLRTSELQPSQLNWFKADSSRLWATIHSTAQWGKANPYGDAPEETGLSRLTLSDSDKAARDWFFETATSLSCKVHVDEIGNIFAIRPGLDNNASATFVGSHLDSQPMGGRFDGVLGVCAGIEMLRVLQDNHIETEGPVGVVNWTNEEGARFPVSMMGSGVWAGAQQLDDIYALQDVSTSENKTTTVQQELERIGYLGSSKPNWQTGIKMAGHFELHIEQGPYLENNKELIGVVEGVQAYQWFEITIQGRASHTGTTGFHDRADALRWASKIIWEVGSIADKEGGLASVGIIKSQPQSINTIPDKVMFTLDIRHAQDETLSKIVNQIKTYIQQVETESATHKNNNNNNNNNSHLQIKTSIKQTFNSPATKFDKEAVQCVVDSSLSLFKDTETMKESVIRRMTSGAGHDSVNTQKHCPTAMIFVPCRDGISHHPREWCSEVDCANGASVLIQSVMRFDRLRYDKGHFGG